MVKEKNCEHEKVLPLYVRDQEEKQWHSTKKITGEMISMCTRCGKIFRVTRRIEKDLEEVKDEI